VIGMTGWAETYRQRVTTADEALRVVRSGDHVWVHAGCNNPEELLRAMVARAAELRGVEVTHLMTFGCATYADPRQAASFRHRSLFTGANVREAVNDGRADFVPVHLSEIPALLRTGELPVDVALIHVSPPDEHGFCSYGVGVECTKPIIALPSTAKSGRVSRIVDVLDAGSGVVTTRADVHYVVTEHGVASLHGRSLRERAAALIEIAHPDFRAELREAARRRKLA
jgi:acyl-CoA hydrolase